MACTSLWALMRVAGPHRRMYIGAWRWREEYIDEVRLNERRKYKSTDSQIPHCGGLGRQLGGEERLPLFRGFGSAPSTDTGGLTQTPVPGCRHSFLAPEATADL